MLGPASPRSMVNSSEVDLDYTAVENITLLSIQTLIKSALDRQYKKIFRLFTEKFDDATRGQF